MSRRQANVMALDGRCSPKATAEIQLSSTRCVGSSTGILDLMERVWCERAGASVPREFSLSRFCLLLGFLTTQAKKAPPISMMARSPEAACMLPARDPSKPGERQRTPTSMHPGSLLISGQRRQTSSSEKL